jgi:hypothetical protein
VKKSAFRGSRIWGEGPTPTSGLLSAQRDRVPRVASKPKKRNAKSRRAAPPAESEHISLLRAIWTEMKGLNARVDETNERLAKTNQRLTKANKRLAKTNDRLDAIRSELTEQLEGAHNDEDSQVGEEVGERISRLERRVGLDQEG